MKKEYSKDYFDRFYTKPDIAKNLIKQLDLSNYNLIIEPSAGNGSFSKQIQDCLAYDLEPADNSIVQQDFLKFEYSGHVQRDKILFIGNPPFGRQCSLAVKFIIKCASIGDTIAFILPLSFKKDSVQKRVPSNFHLMKSIRLDKNSFTLNGMSYDVPCVFQIWKNLYKPREYAETVLPQGFSYCKNDKILPQIAIRRVGVYAGRAFVDYSKKSNQSHYFIKFDNDEISPEQVCDRLNLHIWEHGNTVGPRSISKSEINKVLNEVISNLTKK